jgi:hypothetical protein
MVQRLALLSLAGCSILGSTSDSNVERGTVHVIAFTEEGTPAEGADVVVHDAYGEVVARGTIAADGTADVDSVANATVSVAMRFSRGASVVKRESGVITSFASVPLDATLHIGIPNIAVGAPISVDVELPPITPEPLAFLVDIGCGDLPSQHSHSFRLQIPAGCAAQPRTLVVKAFSQSASTTGVSVVQGVDLHNTGVIQMPAFQELRTVTVDVAGHDPANGVLFGSTAVLNDGGSFNFIGDEGPTGRVLTEVPPGPWETTRYKVSLPFLDAETLRSTEIVRFESGAPQSVTIPESDFLALPVADPSSSNPLAFTFEGTPDFRSVFVTYRCLKCGSFALWNLVAPPGPEPLVLPEMPADFQVLTPEGSLIEAIEARIFDSSALADYAAFLASDVPLPGDSRARIVPGTTERFAFNLLLQPPDDRD